MTNHFFDRLKDIFNILKLIRMIPLVLGISNPISGRITLSVDHLFVRLRLSFLPIV